MSSESDSLWVQRIDVITKTAVEGALYGFTFALYIFCFHSLYLQRKDPQWRKQNFFVLLNLSLMMACGLITLCVDAQNIKTSYVDHVDYPGGGFLYSVFVFGERPVAVLGYSVGILLDILTSGTQIWRLWTIWNRTSRYSLLIVITPILALFAYAAIYIVSVVGILRPTTELAVSVIYGSKGLFLFITAFVTCLITAKIALVRRQHKKFMGQSDVANQYTSIISMLVESFALESLWVMLAIIFSTIVNMENSEAVGDFFATTRPFIQILAYLLVVYRVTTGRGWSKETEQEVTSLQWNRHGLQTSQLATQVSLPVSQEPA